MRYSFLSLFATGILATSLAQANTTITFEGEVSPQTCKVMVNGQTNAVVLLPTVHTTALNKENDVAGLTPFTISLTGCDASKRSNVTLHLVGTNVNDANNLSNRASANEKGATGVAIQVLETNGTTPITFKNGDIALVHIGMIDGTELTHKLHAQYIRTAETLKPGRVTAQTQYSISYL